MKLILTISLLFSICQAQVIVADGVTDNSPAFRKLCAKGGEIILPSSGVVVITEPIPMGDMFITAKQAASYMPPFNGRLYNSTRWRKCCKLKGNGFVTILKKFKDTTLPAIIITAQDRHGDYKHNAVEGITIKGKGPGIVIAWAAGTELLNIQFVGLTDALVLNNAGGFSMTNVDFQNCDRAAYIIQSACGHISNATVSGCRMGFEVRTNQLVFNSYVAEYTQHGLWVAAGNNVFNSVYLENPLANNQQLIIGNDTGSVKDKVDGNIFNALTIACSHPTSRAIVFKNTAGTMEIHGGGILSALYQVDSLCKAKVIATSFTGELPKSVQ